MSALVPAISPPSPATPRREALPPQGRAGRRAPDRPRPLPAPDDEPKPMSRRRPTRPSRTPPASARRPLRAGGSLRWQPGGPIRSEEAEFSGPISRSRSRRPGRSPAGRPWRAGRRPGPVRPASPAGGTRPDSPARRRLRPPPPPVPAEGWRRRRRSPRRRGQDRGPASALRMRAWKASAASLGRSGSGRTGGRPSACRGPGPATGGRSGRTSRIGTGRPLIRLPRRSIGESPGKGTLPRDQVVHGAAEAEQVAAAVDVAPGGLLRRHVVDRPHRDPVGRGEGRLLVRLHQGAEAQVEHLDLPVLAQQQVRRLDVAVDDPHRVGVRQPAAPPARR